MQAQMSKYQPPQREVGGQGVPSHSRGITGWDPTAGCSRNRLRAAWGGICAIHRWHTCKDTAARLGYRCWCPQRHPCSWECPNHDQLHVLVP